MILQGDIEIRTNSSHQWCWNCYYPRAIHGVTHYYYLDSAGGSKSLSSLVWLPVGPQWFVSPGATLRKQYGGVLASVCTAGGRSGDRSPSPWRWRLLLFPPDLPY